MIQRILYSSIILLVLISTASATTLTIGTPDYSSSVLKDDSFTVSVSVEAASVTSQISVTVTLTDNTNGVSITGAEQTKTFSNNGTQNIQWSVRANNPGTYSNPFTITATSSDGETASPKTSTTSLSIKDRPVLTANVTQNVTNVSANGYVQLSYTITNVASADAASATNINATLSTIPSGWTAISTTNHSISSLSAGGSQTSGYYIVQASSTAASYNLNMTITSAQGDSLSKGWTVTVASSGSDSGSGSSTSSGGGGGGGGGLTAEPYENIAKTETYDRNLVSNTPVLYTFKLPEHGIYEIYVTGKETENSIGLKVEALKGPTKIAGISAPPGIVYKNMNIWSGSKRIKEGLLRFKVEKTWITDNNIANGELFIVRWNGNEWTKLETSETKNDSTYTFYEAKTEGFSSFAITALKGGVMPAVTQVVENNPISGTPAIPIGTQTAPEETKKGTPGFGFAFALSILSAVYLFRRNRR